MKATFFGLIVSCALIAARAGLMDGLVAWYPLADTLTNQVNRQQVATLLDGAVLNSDAVAVNGNAVRIPAPFASATSVFSVSLFVYETGLTDSAGGAYLVAGEGINNVFLMTHEWVNRWEHPEGSYYGACLGAQSTNNYNEEYFVASLDAGAIRSHWVHYVFVSNTNEVTLFQNGVRIGSVAIPGFPVNGDWFLGKHWWYTGWLSVVSSERIIGKFKCMRVYSRALSNREVSQLYAVDGDLPLLSINTAAVRLGWFAKSNVSYQVQWSSDFQTWSNLTSVLGMGAETNLIEWVDGSRKFYRVRATP